MKTFCWFLICLGFSWLSFTVVTIVLPNDTYGALKYQECMNGEAVLVDLAKVMTTKNAILAN